MLAACGTGAQKLHSLDLHNLHQAMLVSKADILCNLKVLLILCPQAIGLFCII